MRSLFAIVLGLIALSTATVHFQETFSGDWEKRWVPSTFKEAEGTQGKWEVEEVRDEEGLWWYRKKKRK
jgi:hypothetical protein